MEKAYSYKRPNGEIVNYRPHGSENPDGTINMKRNGRISRFHPDKIPEFHKRAQKQQSPKVYFVRAAGTNWYKIGFTRGALTDRIRSLSHGWPVGIEVVDTTEGDVTLERRLHKYLSLYRMKGEWFQLPDRIAWQVLICFGHINKALAKSYIRDNKSFDQVHAEKRSFMYRGIVHAIRKAKRKERRVKT